MFPQKTNKAFSLIELSIVVLIIGILIAGVTSGSKLYDKFKLQTGQALTRSSPVNGIKDLVLWYETSLDASFPSDQNIEGTQISAWYDINPQKQIKNNATQSSSSRRPIFRDNVVNGLPALRFDGSNDYFDFDGSSLLNTNYTIFAVSQRRSGSDWNFFISGSSCTPSAADNLMVGYMSSYALQSHCGGGRGDVHFDFSSYSAPVPHVFTAWFSQSVGKKLRINGVTPRANSDKTPVTSFAGSSIGKYVNLYYYSGDISEIIIFNRDLNNEERLAVEKYLSQKYAISMSVS